MMRLWIFGLLAFFATFARADILMLDLNNSQAEYTAAKKAAAARGEKLVRIPPIDEETEKEFRGATDRIWTAIVAKRKVCASDTMDAETCKTAQTAIADARKDYKDLTAKVTKVDAKMLSQTLATMKESGAKVTSMVISGHDGDRDFGGIWTHDLTEDDITKAFKENEPVADDVRSLLLWGCYTSTVADFRDSWKKAFPNLNILGGFDAMGPNGDAPSNGRYLRDLLQKEKSLSEVKTRKDLETIANSLEGISDLHASFCIDRSWIVQKHHAKVKVLTMDEAHADCEVPDETETNLQNQFQCYLDAAEGCENPPPNPKTNVLRQYYEVLQKNRHCTEVMAGKGIERPHYAQARRLLFDNTVRSSFNRLHVNELATFNALLDKLGVPKKWRMKNLGMISRREYLDRMQALKRAYAELETRNRDASGRLRDARVIAMGMYLDQIHKIEDARCVPLSWIEGHSPEEGRCGTRRAMSTIMSRAEKRATKE
jgi:hypothetical protein